MLGPNRAPQKSLLNIHELLEHVRRLVQAEAPAEVTLLRDYDPSIPEITIDREQIIQAVLNVLRNALQAVGSAGTIIFRTRTRRQEIGRAHVGTPGTNAQPVCPLLLVTTN